MWWDSIRAATVPVLAETPLRLPLRQLPLSRSAPATLQSLLPADVPLYQPPADDKHRLPAGEPRHLPLCQPCQP